MLAVKLLGQFDVPSRVSSIAISLRVALLLLAYPLCSAKTFPLCEKPIRRRLPSTYAPSVCHEINPKRWRIWITTQPIEGGDHA